MENENMNSNENINSNGNTNSNENMDSKENMSPNENENLNENIDSNINLNENVNSNENVELGEDNVKKSESVFSVENIGTSNEDVTVGENINPNDILEGKIPDIMKTPEQEAKRILVIEDNEAERTSLRLALEAENFVVEVAENGADAENVIRFNVFDVAIVDYKLPDTDGLSLIRKLRATVPDMTPLVVTAYSSVEIAIEALKMGAYDYIVKPFDVPSLIKVISNIIKDKETLISSKNKLGDYQAKQQINYMFNDDQISIITAQNPDILAYDENKFNLIDKIKKFIKGVKNFYWGS